MPVLRNEIGVGMSDIIRREDAIDAMITLGLKRAIPILETLPSAEPERKKGKWKPFDLTWNRSVYSCTACGEAMDIPTEKSKPIYSFCPHCGADMRGE